MKKKKLYQYQPNTDQLTMLNCRLACKQWNNIIENTSELIKRITFTIQNLEEFLSWRIVKEKKVKSIKTTNCWWPDWKPKIAKEFFDFLINSGIEKIHFNFVINGYRDFEFELVKSILNNCTKLQELIVNEFVVIDKNIGLSGRPAMLFSRFSTNTFKIAAAFRIHTLVYNKIVIEANDAAGLMLMISKLPQLKEIKLIGECGHSEGPWPVSIICKGLIEDLNKFGQLVN